jgi:hypothetical protein
VGRLGQLCEEEMVRVSAEIQQWERVKKGEF